MNGQHLSGVGPRLALGTALAAALVGLSPSPAESAGGPVLVTAVFYDGYVVSGTTETEEAVQIMNVGAASVDIGGWSLTDNEASAAFLAGTSLAPGQRLWLAYSAADFRGLFGFSPDFEYGLDSDPGVPNLTGTAPRLANGGDEVVLRDASSVVMDAVVFEAGQTTQTGWSGTAVQPYNVFPMNPVEQLVFRKLDEATGYPAADTDTADDWATSKTGGAALYGPVKQGDISGKKAMVPGWDMGIYGATTAPSDFWVPLKVTENASTTVLVAPDNIYDGYIGAINNAQQSLYIEGYTFGHREIGEAVAARALAGVQVKVLLEGGPCCADVPEPGDLWIAQQIVAAGGQVYFMHDETAAAGAHDRYNFQHAKFTIVDAGTPAQLLLTGTENLNCGSMPSDDKSNGTAGNRGTYVKTDAPTVIDHYLRVFNLDLDPANHRDIVPYGSSATYTWDGVTVPASCTASDGTVYTVQKPAPLTLSGSTPFEVVQAPENAVRYTDSLIGMVRRAGPGDTVLVEQAYERKFWGLSTSNPDTDPNPRLEAYIEAARRGAKVRIVFDAEFDDPTDARGNSASVGYVGSVASAEGLDLEARLVDCTGCLGPAGGGIHNKMVLVHDRDGGTAWAHIGSINGSENSSKFNREMALQIESLEAFCYLYDVYNYDWKASGAADLGLGCGPANTPPTASIANPANGSTVSGTLTIRVSAGDAEDAAGTLTVQVAIDGGAWQSAAWNAVSGAYERAWDTTTVANGSHTIDARASDSAGATTSAAPVTVTVSNAPPNATHVGDLDGSSASSGRNNWVASVTVTIHDASHALVSGASVTGTWSGGFTGTGSCTTGAGGQCSVASGGIPKKKPNATFTVDGVTHATLSYQPSSNHDPDGDSSGTAITVLKP